VRLAVLNAPRRLELVDEPVPEPGPGEVLLRFPRFPGHEVSGTVERLGPGVNRFTRGDPVAAWVTGRGFAEYVVVRAEYCFSAASVPLDLALAEPLACAVNAVELAAPARGRRLRRRGRREVHVPAGSGTQSRVR
jgi:L-iditol 2-dehydrogenase